jgi:dipeptidyl aminopeptidase/acylaminoacyl peptidase
MIPGGSWQSVDRTSMAALAKQVCTTYGYNVFVVSYRVLPEFRFTSQLDDVLNAIYYAKKQFFVEPTKIAVWGESAGGWMASWACVMKRVKLGLADAGPHQLNDAHENVINFLNGASAVWGSSSSNVQAGAAPMYLTHGLQDTTVPPARSQALKTAYDALGISCTYTTYTGGHLGVPSSVRTLQLAWLSANL